MHKISATIYRDFKEYLANYSVLTLLLMPIVMAVIYRMIGNDAGQMLPDVMVFIIIGTVLAAVSTNVPLTLFADEIEHGMIRMVARNKKDLWLIIIGRSILVILVTILLIILSLLIVDHIDMLTLDLLIGVILAILVFLSLGILFGVRSKLESTSTVAGVIILFFLGMTPLVENMGLTSVTAIRVIVDLTPIYQLMAIQDNANITPYVILLVWLTIIVFLIYKSLDISKDS